MLVRYRMTIGSKQHAPIRRIGRGYICGRYLCWTYETIKPQNEDYNIMLAYIDFMEKDNELWDGSVCLPGTIPPPTCPQCERSDKMLVAWFIGA